MIFLSEIRDPIEVYEAAIGKPERLIERLKSNHQISQRERWAIAALLNGELVPPTRTRGAPKKRRASSMFVYGTRPIEMARTIYENKIAAQKREGISTYGRSREIADQVAKDFGIDPNKFADFLKRTKPKPADFKPIFDIVEGFQEWWLEHGNK